MATTINNLQVNGEPYSGGQSIIKLTTLTLNWEIATASNAIRQSSFELRIGTHSFNWGSSQFQGDVYAQPSVRSRGKTVSVPQKFFVRGVLYYGQIRVRSTDNANSEWVTFQFIVNPLPFIQNQEITPSSPSEGDDLVLSYSLTQSGAGARIRWFRNGVRYQQFDDYDKISREYVRFNDVWFSEIIPFNSLEQGDSVYTQSITITQLPPVVSNLEILPRNPNNNDILEASYAVLNQNTDSVLLDDKSKIVWYVNDIAIDVANDARFVRFDFRPGDIVRFLVTPYDGVSFGPTADSDSITIEDSGFVVNNVRIDGSNRNLSVKSVNPTVEWDISEPLGRVSQYAQINVGTAPGSDNIYTTVIKTFSEQFTIPDNTVQRGVDYFVSVSSSDSSDNFFNPSFGRFRIAGSLWEREVSNSDGWTMEVAVRVEGEGGYQRFSFADGTHFAELRFYPAELQLFLGGANVKSVPLDLLSMKNILLVGQGDTLKIFLNNVLVIDATDEFTAPASDRFIEVGTTADSEIIGHFKRVVYTTDGAFDPTIDPTAFAQIEFEPLITFTSETVTDIIEHDGDVLVSVNSRNPDQSGSIYRIVETEQSEIGATEAVDKFDINLNSFSSSPDGSRTFIAHSKGASYFDNYFIDSYDLFTRFPVGRNPQKDNWELVDTTPFNAISFTGEGMLIDTTFANQSRVDDRVILSEQSNAAAFSMRFLLDIPFLNTVHVKVTVDEMIFYSIGVEAPGNILFTEPLANRTVGDIVDSLKSRDSFEDFFIGEEFLVAIEIDEFIRSQSASNLNELDFSPLYPLTVFRGTFLADDPYNPGPYSSTAGGKWFYSHRKPGTPWFDNVDNDKGWTIDFDIRLDSVEDSDRPSDVSDPEGAGIYINDGKYSENILFLPQEIMLSNTNRSLMIDTTSLNRYRLVGREDKLQVWAKKPADRVYELLGETLMNANGSNAGDAGRPKMFSDQSGNLYATWHDSGNGSKRQIYFAEYNEINGWTDPLLLVSEDFDASHPDISVDGLGNVYVIFETSRSDYTDIAAIQRVNGSWSDAYLVSSNLANSLRPSIAIDENNSVHVVWEDYRNGQPEIFYARRNSANGQWESGAFGQGDTQITRTIAGGRRPKIIARGLSLYTAFTTVESSGNSQVKLAYYAGSGNYTRLGGTLTTTGWRSSGQDGTDFLISTVVNPNNNNAGGVGSRADNVSLVPDVAGNIVAVWEDVSSGVFQVYGRLINSRLTWARPIQKLTEGTRDSRFPEASLDLNSGYVYIAFEKSLENVADPYDPYDPSFSDPGFGNFQSSIYLARYNSLTRQWEGSGIDEGFDVHIEEPDLRVAHRPSSGAYIYNGKMHILYQSGDVAENLNESLKNNRLFFNIRDAVYNLDWQPSVSIGLDPYNMDDLLISNETYRKEIRFGDFSNNIGYRMLVNQIRYYTGGEVRPFQIGLVSSATVDMPRAEVLATAGNNYGDMWLGTTDGLIYFDRLKNESSVFQDSSHGIEGLTIFDIKFDTYSNMYLATNDGVYISSDHAYFFKLTGDGAPTSSVSLDIDSKRRLFVGTESSGFYIIDTAQIVSSLEVTKDNVNSDRAISVSTSVVFNKQSGMPTNTVTKVRIDANDVVWVGTSQGLVRYKDGNITTFTQENGLVSNKINDIAIRDTARRYIATSAGINKMVGIGIEKLDFGNINSPNASLQPSGAGDIAIPKFNNAISIRWQEPNHLLVGTMHDIYQITFVDEPFSTERPQITRFRSQDFTLITVMPVRNDDLQTFRLIGLEDREIPENVLYEVILNGNKITRGFNFSSSFRLLRFDYPLLESDVVQINIRFDIEIVNRFEQNQASKVAEGTRITDVDRMLSANGNIYAMTGGDVNNIQINDETTNLPFDRITLDTTPPQGIINIDGQVNSTTLRVLINQVQSGDEYLPFDNVSGIDSLIVSNFTNFTTDGETPQDPIPFITSINHPIDAIFDDVTKQFDFPSGKGRRMLLFTPPGGSPTIFAGTASPAQVFAFDPISSLWELRDTLDDGDADTSIEFMVQYQNKIFVGTGNPNGSGKIYVSTNGQNFVLATVLPVSYAYTAEELNGILYIGAGEPEGYLFSYNGSEYETIFRHVSGSIIDLVSAQGELYAGTGSEGRIYRLDPQNLTQQILNTDVDSRIISIGTADVNGTGFIFSGTSSTAQIKRSKLPDGAFIHSFKTISAPVYSMENIDGTLWTAIGNSLFALENVWNAKYTHTEEIRDVVGGVDGDIWFVSDSSIYRVSEQQESRKVYLKLTDRAGNETNLFTDDAQTQLDPNLFDEITLEELAGFTNQNRILEVDEFGNTVGTIDGDARFYSADKVDEEIGVYFSEVFNGTNGLVSWDRITWDAIIPENTTLKIFIRTGNSRDDLLDAEFLVEIDGSESVFSDISFVNGQYLQFKIEMMSTVRNLSPSLRSVVVRSLASESTHFFTTNFVLPSRVKSGMLTSTKMIPIAADIVFGVNTNNSVDFAEYQIIDENRIFTTDDKQVGEGLRVGIRLITPSRGETIADDFGEYGPYDSQLFFNSIEWDFSNASGIDDIYHFRVSFFEDMQMENLVFQAYSADSQAGFSFNSDRVQSTGVPIDDGVTVSMSYVPVGDTPLTCNTFYWMKIESVNAQDDFDVIFNDRTFVEACGTTFVDSVDFDYSNDTAITKNFHFRVRFYSDAERTELLTTSYSGNDTNGWFVGGTQNLPAEGVNLTANESVDISLTPDLSLFEARTTYYLSIDAFDGSVFTNTSNSFTFRATDTDTSIYCGPYVDVPVVTNFAIAFELEGNQRVILKGS